MYISKAAVTLFRPRIVRTIYMHYSVCSSRNKFRLYSLMHARHYNFVAFLKYTSVDSRQLAYNVVCCPNSTTYRPEPI